MLHNFHLSNFLGSLCVAQNQNKSLFTYKPATKFIIANLKLLTKEGLIYGYVVKQVGAHKQVDVWLKYYDRCPLIRSIKFYTSPGCYWYITFKRLFKFAVMNRGSTFVLSSADLGIHTAYFSLVNKTGGLLLYKIN